MENGTFLHQYSLNEMVLQSFASTAKIIASEYKIFMHV